MKCHLQTYSMDYFEFRETLDGSSFVSEIALCGEEVRVFRRGFAVQPALGSGDIFVPIEEFVEVKEKCGGCEDHPDYPLLLLARLP